MMGRDVDVGMGDKNQNIKFACDMFKRWQKLRGCCWPTKGRWDSWPLKEKNSIGGQRQSKDCLKLVKILPDPLPCPQFTFYALIVLSSRLLIMSLLSQICHWTPYWTFHLFIGFLISRISIWFPFIICLFVDSLVLFIHCFPDFL